MKIHYFKKGFNFSQDGPGNRLVYHLMGCNLRCPWCSNPEGMSFSRNGKGIISAETAELVREARSCVPVLIDGGGVTLTGGEVCVQAEAAYELLRALRAEGINTAIETNVSLPAFRGLIGECDYIICDVKHWDETKLFAATGGRLSDVSDNLRYALDAGYFLHLRIPLINGFNASGEDKKGFSALLSGFDKSRFDLELLQYHEYGRIKWEKLGLEYAVKDGFVSPETLSDFREAFAEAGIKLIKT